MLAMLHLLRVGGLFVHADVLLHKVYVKSVVKGVVHQWQESYHLCA